MAHNQIKGKRKGLNVWSIGNKQYYKLYDTVIVIAEYLEDGNVRIRLNHNGFKTNHTKNCMNDFLSRFGFKVFQKDFQWYVQGHEVPFSFENEMVYITAIKANVWCDGWTIGYFIEEPFKPYTPTTWNETFCHGQYSPTLK